MIGMTSSRHGRLLEAVPYLFGDRDAKGTPRLEVTLVRGSAATLATFAALFPQKRSYDSFIVSFHEGEELSAVQLQQFLGDFDKAMFPGLAGRVPTLAVVHGNGHSKHLHVLTLRVDLWTNKQCSAVAFGIRPLKELCRTWNFRHEWADPEDPFRVRLASWTRPVRVVETQPGSGLLRGVDVHEVCRRHAVQAVLSDKVHNQEEMAESLRAIGQVVRCTPRWISLDVPGVAPRGKRQTTVVRLVGLLYDRDFDRTRILQMLSPTPLLAMYWRRNTPEADAQLALVLHEELEEKTRRRAALLQDRFMLEAQRAALNLTTQLFFSARHEPGASLAMAKVGTNDESRFSFSTHPNQSSSHVTTFREASSNLSTVSPHTFERGGDRTLRAGTSAAPDPTVLAGTLSHAAREIARVVLNVVRRSLTAALQALHAAASSAYGDDRGGGVAATAGAADSTAAGATTAVAYSGCDDREPDDNTSPGDIASSVVPETDTAGSSKLASRWRRR